MRRTGRVAPTSINVACLCISVKQKTRDMSQKGVGLRLARCISNIRRTDPKSVSVLM